MRGMPTECSGSVAHHTEGSALLPRQCSHISVKSIVDPPSHLRHPDTPVALPLLPRPLYILLHLVRVPDSPFSPLEFSPHRLSVFWPTWGADPFNDILLVGSAEARRGERGGETEFRKVVDVTGCTLKDCGLLKPEGECSHCLRPCVTAYMPI